MILTPVTSQRWTVPPQQSVGGLALPLSCVKKPFHNKKVSRSRGADFKEARSELSGLWNTFVPFTNTHFLWRELAGGEAPGEAFWSSATGLLMLQELCETVGQNMKGDPAALLPSEGANTKRKKSVAFWLIYQPQLRSKSSRGVRRRRSPVMKICSVKIRNSVFTVIDHQRKRGWFTQRSQQGEKTTACVVSHRHKHRDLQREINNFVKWGKDLEAQDENSPQVLFDQVRRYTVFSKSCRVYFLVEAFEPSPPHTVSQLKRRPARVKLWALETLTSLPNKWRRKPGSSALCPLVIVCIDLLIRHH